MLEHSFPKMTWHASIRQEVDAWTLIYGWALIRCWCRVGLCYKREKGIRVADGVLVRWELRCLNQYVNSKDN
jgi:hypothetical protein